MKIRTGFVSNSSSSSFIVIAYNNNLVSIDNNGQPFIHDCRDGEYKFGWQVFVYNSLSAKLNFAILQALTLDSSTNSSYHMDMIYRVVCEYTNSCSFEHNLTIEWEVDLNDKTGKRYGYIDHQSSASEGMNIEMFASDESLKSFLFSEKSYINNKNDNY